MGFPSRKIAAVSPYTPPRPISFFALSKFFDKLPPSFFVAEKFGILTKLIKMAEVE